MSWKYLHPALRAPLCQREISMLKRLSDITVVETRERDQAILLG
jgi:hypothetical protein